MTLTLVGLAGLAFAGSMFAQTDVQAERDAQALRCASGKLDLKRAASLYQKACDMGAMPDCRRFAEMYEGGEKDARQDPPLG